MWAQVLWFRVQDSGFRGSGFTVWGIGIGLGVGGLRSRIEGVRSTGFYFALRILG